VSATANSDESRGQHVVAISITVPVHSGCLGLLEAKSEYRLGALVIQYGGSDMALQEVSVAKRR
jgi:hypothetical protein